MTHIRVGTRGSALALIQAEQVAALLRDKAGATVEIVEISTKGDQDRQTPLTQGQGWFTTAIQQALSAGDIDVAVHSYKDLPTKRPVGLVIAAVPYREDPRDALVTNCARHLRDLPAGAKVGTSSPRRAVQVLAIRPDLRIEPIRGNVDTRIQKVRDGEYDAAVLAFAGLKRLGREREASHVFGYEEMLPAPAQGALAVECRENDTGTFTAVSAIDDATLRPLVTAERVFLATLEAGCSFPAAAYAQSFGTTLKLHALVEYEGTLVRSRMGGPVGIAAGLGRELALELLQSTGMRSESQG